MEVHSNKSLHWYACLVHIYIYIYICVCVCVCVCPIGRVSIYSTSACGQKTKQTIPVSTSSERFIGMCFQTSLRSQSSRPLGSAWHITASLEPSPAVVVRSRHESAAALGPGSTGSPGGPSIQRRLDFHHPNSSARKFCLKGARRLRLDLGLIPMWLRPTAQT